MGNKTNGNSRYSNINNFFSEHKNIILPTTMTAISALPLTAAIVLSDMEATTKAAAIVGTFVYGAISTAAISYIMSPEQPNSTP